MSVENYLLKEAQLRPRAGLKKAFRDGGVRVNGKRVDRQHSVSAGDAIEVQSSNVFTPDQAQISANSELQVPTLLEAPDFLVVAKPGGISSHPLRPSETETALNALAAKYPEATTPADEAKPLEGGLVHRLDRGTSGLLVCARNESGWKSLREVWTSRGLEKVYLAWVNLEHVSGSTYPREGELNLELAHDLKNKKKMVVVSETSKDLKWRAHSEFRFLNDTGLVLIRIHTGVMHQIRASLAALKAPVLGDNTYAISEAALKRTPPKVGRLSDETRLLFSTLEKRLPKLSQADTETLPKDAFFLHALWLRSSQIKELENGVLAPIPSYFSKKLF